MINFIIKNTRTGVAIKSCGDAKLALAFVKLHGPYADAEGKMVDGPLGPIQAFTVTTTVTETPLTDAEIIPIKGAGGLRAGRGRG